MSEELQAAIASLVTQVGGAMPAAAQELIAREMWQCSIAMGIGVAVVVVGALVSVAHHDDDNWWGPLAVSGVIGAIPFTVGVACYLSVLWYPRAFLLDYARRFVN